MMPYNTRGQGLEKSTRTLPYNPVNPVEMLVLHIGSRLTVHYESPHVHAHI